MKSIKLKENKGITLVALVITIIVLLILSAVAISTLRDNNIVTKAQTAKDDYKEGAQNEDERIKELENIVNEYPKDGPIPPPTGNFWQQKGLTSNNVQFGKTYTSTTYNKDAKTNATFTIFDSSLTLSESGGQTITMGKADYDTLDDMLNGMIASQSEAPSEEQIESARQQFYQMFLPVNENTVGYSENGGSYLWVIEFDSESTANVYYGSYKNEPKDNEWDLVKLIGTFTVSN